MRVLVIEPPEAVVTLEEAKEHLRVLHDDEDELISGYVASAQGQLEGPAGVLRRSIGIQTLELRTHVLQRSVRLPLPPVISVVSVGYLDEGGEERPVEAGTYYLSGRYGNIVTPVGTPPWLNGSPRLDALRIRYRAGYAVDPLADPLVADVPMAIRTAIMEMVGHLYNNREAVDGRPLPSSLQPYQIFE